MYVFEAVIPVSNFICTQSALHYEKQDMLLLFGSECVCQVVYLYSTSLSGKKHFRFPTTGKLNSKVLL